MNTLKTKNFYHNFQISIFFLFCIFILNPIALKAQSIDLKKIDKYILDAQKEWNIPGMAVAIVKDNKIIFSKGYGLRNVEKKSKVNESTVFAIASNSKAFTTAALSILVDEGKLNWEDKVVDHLPWFKLYSPYVTQNITVRDLVSHRSGLYTFSGDLLWYHTNYSSEDVVRRAQFLKPRYGCREHFGYQNIMFSAAGLILEKISGMSWSKYIKQNFLDPLSMKSSNTSVKDLDLNGNTAIPYHVEPGKKPIAVEYMNWDNCKAAAAINSSVADMAKWMIFQLNGGKLDNKQVISEKQIWEVRKMFTPTPISKQAFVNNPNIHFKGYGLGWNIFDYNGKKVINHGGGSEGMISKVAMIPEENIGIVILTNSINYLPSALTYQFFDMYFGNEDKDWSTLYLGHYKSGLEREKERVRKLKENKITGTKPSFNLNKYKGSYTDIAYGTALIENKNGKLVLKYKPAPDVIGDLEHYHYDVFTVKLRNLPSLPIGTVQFFMDEEGEIKSMKVDIPNPDFYFNEFDFIKDK